MAAKQTPIKGTKATAPQFTTLTKNAGLVEQWRCRYHTLVSIWLRKLGSGAWAGASAPVERRAHAHFGRKAQRSDMLGHLAALIAYVVLRQVPFGIDDGEGKLSSGHSIELSAL